MEWRMHPEEGAQKQIEIYKRMTGRERLLSVFEMWDMAVAMIIASEKKIHPDAEQEEIEKRARMRLCHGNARTD